ncbi:MAG: SDR family oxidoreductase [Ignavibacteriales bacterium]|nr:SDR family oxidoreductase [Ignavibacteriales bacterium]
MTSRHRDTLRILVTGTSRGIGLAVTDEMLARGHTVVGLARTRLESRTSAKFAGRFYGIVCDVRKEADVERSVRKAASLVGPIDMVVHSAGITAFREFRKTSIREFDDVLDTNLRGTILVTKAVLPAMIRRRSGTIVNIVSYAAKTVYTDSSAYSASKAGVTALMNSLREEVRKYNIKIVNVFPGAVETAMWPVSVRKKYGKVMMSPAELAQIVCDAVTRPAHHVVEELVVRPVVGDLRI